MKNLRNTKWIFDQDPVLNSILGFNINFTSNGHRYVKLTVEQAMNPNYELKYYQDGDVIDYPYHTGNSWQNEAFKTIIIQDGIDADNPDLIAFLQANATQEVIKKNIVLEKDNVELFPRTKASLLVEDDGSTPFVSTSVIANNGQATTDTLSTLQVGDTNYIVTSGGGDISFEEIIPPDSLLGTWVFDVDRIGIEFAFYGTETITFNCSGIVYNSMKFVPQYGPNFIDISYGDTKVTTSSGEWVDNKYKTIQITDVSKLEDRVAFEKWLNFNAVKEE